MSKIIGDVIHGYVQLHNEELTTLSSPYFQRLRHLRQNGTAYLVYPNLQHSRFEHSLGVAHIAELFLSDALSLSNPTVVTDFRSDARYFLDSFVRPPRLKSDGDLDDTLLLLVRSAGLLHDIGHLPLSHTAEHALLSTKWSRNLFPAAFLVTKPHELLGLQIVRSAPDLFQTDWLRRGVFLVLASYIPDFLVNFKEVDARGWRVAKLLRELITGEIDCDRSDFILRDLNSSGRYFGGYDLRRLSHSVRIIKDGDSFRLAIDIRGLRSVESSLFARYQLYKTVVWHHKTLFYDEIAKRMVARLIETGNWPAALFTVENRSAVDRAPFVTIIKSLKESTDDWLTVPLLSWVPEESAYQKLLQACLVDEAGEAPLNGEAARGLRLRGLTTEEVGESLDDVWLLGALRKFSTQTSEARDRAYLSCLLSRQPIGLSVWKDFAQFSEFRSELDAAIRKSPILFTVELRSVAPGELLCSNCHRYMRGSHELRTVVQDFFAAVEETAEGHVQRQVGKEAFLLLHPTSLRGFGDMRTVAIAGRDGTAFGTAVDASPALARLNELEEVVVLYCYIVMSKAGDDDVLKLREQVRKVLVSTIVSQLEKNPTLRDVMLKTK